MNERREGLEGRDAPKEHSDPKDVSISSERAGKLERLAAADNARDAERAVEREKLHYEQRSRFATDAEMAQIEKQIGGDYLKEPRTDRLETMARSGEAPVPRPAFSEKAELLLPDDRAKAAEFKNTFDGPVHVERLKAGDKIYRVFDATGAVDGAYWSKTPPPESEDRWRNRDAVLQRWNGNGAYVEYTVPEGKELYVLSGKPAAQPAGEKTHYEGEGTQIVIPGGAGCLDQPGSVKYFRSKWATESSAA